MAQSPGQNRAKSPSGRDQAQAFTWANTSLEDINHFIFKALCLLPPGRLGKTPQPGLFCALPFTNRWQAIGHILNHPPRSFRGAKELFAHLVGGGTQSLVTGCPAFYLGAAGWLACGHLVSTPRRVQVPCRWGAMRMGFSRARSLTARGCQGGEADLEGTRGAGPDRNTSMSPGDIIRVRERPA